MKTKLFYSAIVCLISFSINSQNLLQTNSWTIGSGSVSGFGQNGATSENSRELGSNHLGEEVVLWKAIPDASSNADGGWNTSWIYGIDSNTSYRYSVWIKKTNSNDGSTYFGFNANESGSLRLNGIYYSNPYFFAGDLPELNKWYLLVGYVHKSSHTGTVNIGGIYDGTTGGKVRTIIDYKLKNTVTALRHRSYLYYDTNTLDRQYFYEPRIDRINGNEPSIHELLQINDDSKLIISYDIAGNQTQNFYCDDPSFCIAPAGKVEGYEENSISIIADDTGKEEFENSSLEKTLTKNLVNVYPNPTSGLITIRLEDDLLRNVHSIKFYNSNSTLVKTLETKENKLQLDLSNMALGVYYVHIHLIEGKSITKKIIKK